MCVSEALHLRVCRCACLDHAQTLMYMVSASLSTLCVCRRYWAHSVHVCSVVSATATQPQLNSCF